MKKKKNQIINFAIIIINVKLNNIFVTLTDSQGNVIFSQTSSRLGFKGIKKKTSFVLGELLNTLFLYLSQKNIVVKLFMIDIRCF